MSGSSDAHFHAPKPVKQLAMDSPNLAPEMEHWYSWRENTHKSYRPFKLRNVLTGLTFLLGIPITFYQLSFVGKIEKPRVWTPEKKQRLGLVGEDYEKWKADRQNWLDSIPKDAFKKHRASVSKE
eukprot:TRINITY_DN263_c0_g1_i1.p1 TRINITY_DN263_c0_g1~~TRINITY_DN263_c0_g1_i1.p1  ORF type:complete len:125 (-),score=31.96 TRINITY_DN263_c0_g1_i1:200-574(-)